MLIYLISNVIKDNIVYIIIFNNDWFMILFNWERNGNFKVKHLILYESSNVSTVFNNGVSKSKQKHWR